MSMSKKSIQSKGVASELKTYFNNTDQEKSPMSTQLLPQEEAEKIEKVLTKKISEVDDIIIKDMFKAIKQAEN